MNDTFYPPWWLRNAHAQTLLATLIRRRIALNLHWQRMELPDGDFLDLAWDGQNFSQEKRPIVLLLHGLGGNVYSSYSKGLMFSLSQAGYRPVFMHFRGCSGTPNRLVKNYHAGDTADLAFIVKYLQSQYPTAPLRAVGVSIGGNVLLKWLGETGEQNPLKAAAAISVPFDLGVVTTCFMKGWPKLYQAYLLRKIKGILREKMQKMPFPLTFKQLDAIENFRQFDNLVTAPIHGFADAEDYYKRTSCRKYLPTISTPTLIIHAKDDPLMTPDVIPQKEELSPSTQLIVTEQGGHVGFFAPSSQNYFSCWYESTIPSYFRKMANAL